MANQRNCLEITAPCKINLHLKVKERRFDGYHDLESLFLALAFGDLIRCELTGAEGACDIQMDWQFFQEFRIPLGEGEVLPAEKNSVYQAVSLFRNWTGFNRGIRISVKKRIPLGAGLGGGSSDAAAVLKALNVLGAFALTPQVLREMAETLGSDVPFFLSGGAAWVSGRGEQVVPVAAPAGLWVILVYPGFPSHTGEAFRLLDQARLEGEVGAEGASGAGLIQVLSEPPGKWTYRNDFLPLFLTRGEPEEAAAYSRILRDLEQEGADFTGLSGSGSSCFGIFVDGGMAKKAIRVIADERNFIQLTFPLAHFTEGVLE